MIAAIVVGLNASTIALVLVILALIGACMNKWGPAPLILLCVSVLLVLVACSGSIESTAFFEKAGFQGPTATKVVKRTGPTKNDSCESDSCVGPACAASPTR